MVFYSVFHVKFARISIKQFVHTFCGINEQLWENSHSLMIHHYAFI